MDLAPPRADQAVHYADFLRALHKPAPSDAPANPYRGVPLRERAGAVAERLERLRTKTQAITPNILGLWHQALAAPEAGEVNWLHGDLHSRNVLLDEGGSPV